MADGRQPIRNHRDLIVWQKAMVLRRRGRYARSWPWSRNS